MRKEKFAVISTQKTEVKSDSECEAPVEKTQSHIEMEQEWDADKHERALRQQVHGWEGSVNRNDALVCAVFLHVDSLLENPLKRETCCCGHCFSCKWYSRGIGAELKDYPLKDCSKEVTKVIVSCNSPAELAAAMADDFSDFLQNSISARVLEDNVLMFRAKARNSVELNKQWLEGGFARLNARDLRNWEQYSAEETIVFITDFSVVLSFDCRNCTCKKSYYFETSYKKLLLGFVLTNILALCFYAVIEMNVTFRIFALVAQNLTFLALFRKYVKVRSNRHNGFLELSNEDSWTEDPVGMGSRLSQSDESVVSPQNEYSESSMV